MSTWLFFYFNTESFNKTLNSSTLLLSEICCYERSCKRNRAISQLYITTVVAEGRAINWNKRNQ